MTAIVFTMWFVGSADPARACSCIRPPDEATLDAAADTIIIGRATAVTEHEVAANRAPELEYTVQVEALHKGEIPQPVGLWTASDSAACGVHLDIGQLYKLYPRRTEAGRYEIGLCDGHRLATDADLEPVEPTPSTTGTTIGNRPSATTTTGPPVSSTTSIPPVLPSTSTSTTSTLPPLGSTTIPPLDDDADNAAVDVGDNSDGDAGVLLPAVGGLAVAAVGVAALSMWRRQGPNARPGPY